MFGPDDHCLVVSLGSTPGFGEGFTLRELLAPINLVTGAFGAGAINAQVPTESTRISG